MINAVTFTITTSDKIAYAVSLAQTASTTIRGTFEGSPHDLVGCRAAADGRSVEGTIFVLLFTDKVTVQLLPGGEVAIDIAAYASITGKISDADASAVVAFVRACELPAIET